jgi:hypothetical protein
MSYNVLPKMNNILQSNIQYSDSDILKPIVSNSIFEYHNEIMVEIKKILVDECVFQETLKNYNPYEYLFSMVPSSNQCVSELYESNIFYDLHEIINTIEIIHNSGGTWSCLFVGKHCKNILHVYDTHRFIFDTIFMFEDIAANDFHKISHNMFNFIVYEINYDLTNINTYILKWVVLLKIILNNLATNGDVIIKCDILHHKPIIDMLYIFTNIFKKVYIMKPTTSNVFSFEKYIILKGFTSNYHAYVELKNTLNVHNLNVNNVKKSKTISNIVSNDIPYFFLTKINELNVLFGKQQLEALGDLLNILKHKNKEEKFELLKKINIYKCIHWCDKYDIPCNRFSHILSNRSSFK